MWPFACPSVSSPRPHHRQTNFLKPFLASLGAQVQLDSSHLCCDQLTTVKTGYSLTIITWPYRGLRYRPIEVEYFLKLSAENSLVFQMIAGSRLLFFNSYQICCVYVSIAPHYYDFDFKLTPDAKIKPVFLKDRRGRPFITMVTCCSRSTSNFYAPIG